MKSDGERQDNILDITAVRQTIYNWGLVRFRSAGYGPAQLDMLAAEYLEDLESENVTLRQFEAAARLVRKRCRFFPVMAEILECVAEYRRGPASMLTFNEGVKTAQIEESTTNGKNWTEAEIARNKARVYHITAMLSGRISMDDAVLAVERCGKETLHETMQGRERQQEA